MVVVWRASRAGRWVVAIDNCNTPGRGILVSGGGGWDFTNLYGGTMIFPGDSGYLKMGNCLMSYSKRGSNALIKFDYTDTLQIKYANHGSTMTLNTQGTAYAGVTAQLWGNSSRPVVYEVG
ncbi:hypothetical protein FQ035_23880, partial [Escherichia coli]|nr:hypothetical protein [Escherichia coli]